MSQSTTSAMPDRHSIRKANSRAGQHRAISITDAAVSKATAQPTSPGNERADWLDPVQAARLRDLYHRSWFKATFIHSKR